MSCARDQPHRRQALRLEGVVLVDTAQPTSGTRGERRHLALGAGLGEGGVAGVEPPRGGAGGSLCKGEMPSVLQPRALVGAVPAPGAPFPDRLLDSNAPVGLLEPLGRAGLEGGEAKNSVWPGWA